MKIIAFSWSSRTGKSTAITTMKELFEKQGKKVKVFWETAQMYIDAHDWKIEDRYDFERFIVEKEIERIYEIKNIKEKQQYDIVLIDRAFLDVLVYIYRSIINRYINNADILSHTTEIEISKELYDIVVFFDTMLIPDKNFADYNNKDINAIFRHSMQSVYGDKLLQYPNNKEFEKDIDVFLQKHIQ